MKSSLSRKRRDSVASLPVRGAWIEICEKHRELVALWVAPRAGSVD